MRVFFAFWPVFSPVLFYGFGVWVGLRLGQDKDREHDAYVRGWNDALSKPRVVLETARRILEDKKGGR